MSLCVFPWCVPGLLLKLFSACSSLNLECFQRSVKLLWPYLLSPGQSPASGPAVLHSVSPGVLSCGQAGCFLPSCRGAFSPSPKGPPLVPLALMSAREGSISSPMTAAPTLGSVVFLGAPSSSALCSLRPRHRPAPSGWGWDQRPQGRPRAGAPAGMSGRFLCPPGTVAQPPSYPPTPLSVFRPNITLLPEHRLCP